MLPFRISLELFARGRLSVFLFHRVPPRCHPLVKGDIDLVQFDQLMQLIAENFRVIPLQDAVNGLLTGKLPPRAACITFDDGYTGWLTGVVPILQARNQHATFFITSGQFEGQPMWHERIVQSIEKSTAPRLRLLGLDQEITLESPEQKRNAIGSLQETLKYQPLARREDLLLELEAWAGVSPDSLDRMPASDLRALHSLGFGIGAHTINHPILRLCSDAEAKHEIAASRDIVQSIAGGKVDLFAYPNGIAGTDFTVRDVRLVQEAGYAAAVTTQLGAARLHTSAMQIPRFTPWGPNPARMLFQLVRNLATPAVQLDESAQEAADPLPRRKVLMVAFHFPPQAGSSGIQRTLNFVKYLPRQGWSPMVMSADPHAYEAVSPDLMKMIPPAVPVIRPFALDSARHLAVWGKYLLMTALPDRWVSWWFGAVVQGKRLICQHRPDILWSTYPISTAHWIGASLARAGRLKWVADFRDPMITPSFPTHPLERKTRQWVEASVMARADRCVFTTQRAADTYAARYPAAASKCVVIENGYDEEMFARLQPARIGVPDDRLLLLHSGVIYPGDRDPTALFKAIRHLLDAGQLEADKLCVRFRAPHHDNEIRRLAEAQGVAGVIDVAPPIPYQDAVTEMMGADLLLVLQGSNFNTQIPAKIYEYLRAQRPLLALLDLQGDTAAQLRQFQATYFTGIDDDRQIGEALSHWLQQRDSADLQAQLAFNVRQVQQYSRISHTQKLAQLFDSLL
jgi:peptidoglycan/xylan/chitin deacetylase (PgdA/CDA1 family)/glycosyltransferase involved in cell wall biosynthesis